jgi:hypothetical protein
MGPYPQSLGFGAAWFLSPCGRLYLAGSEATALPDLTKMDLDEYAFIAHRREGHALCVPL